MWSFAWDGNFQFMLPREFSFVVEPKASWSKTDADSRYGSGQTSIVNLVNEKAWEGYSTPICPLKLLPSCLLSVIRIIAMR